MLPALLAIAALQAAAAPAAPSTPAAARAPVAGAPVVAAPGAGAPVAGSPEPDLGAPTPEGLDSLRQAYHDSCEVRLYGEYDDMCSALSDQIRQYRAALARAARRPRSR